MTDLIIRAQNEFEEKTKTVTMEGVKKLGIYACLLSYLQTEPISDEYLSHLSSQENILDYLYQTYLDNRHNFYEDIKSSIDMDQILF